MKVIGTKKVLPLGPTAPLMLQSRSIFKGLVPFLRNFSYFIVYFIVTVAYFLRNFGINKLLQINTQLWQDVVMQTKRGS